MQVNSISIQLASQDPGRLMSFYRDTVGLEAVEGMGEALSLGGGNLLFLVDHSQVSGPTREPRAIIDLHISGIEAEHDRLKAAGVQFSRDKGVEYWGGIISTFSDPDGNTVQLIDYRPELAREENAPAPALA